VGNSLISELNTVSNSLKEGKETPAINKLNAFINHVSAQKGKHIDEAQADNLIEKAKFIIPVIELK